MKYGTQTREKFIYPYIRNTLDQGLSPTAKKRLKWMLYIHEGNSIAKCSRHFDIPERTVWYWVNRFNVYKPKSLENKSRKPQHTRYSLIPLSQRVRTADLRKKYPNWGREKIQKLLKKEGISIGVTRIQTIINQSGLKRRRRKYQYGHKNRRHMYTVPREYLSIPGGLVYFDVKHLRLAGSSGKVYQFTAIDHSTRYLCAKVYRRITSFSGMEFFLYVKEKLGGNTISYVGSDNGSEFLGFFEKVLSEQNVTHVFSSPHSPKQNPYVERVIKTIIDDLYTYFGTETDIVKQQNTLDEYIFTYNNIRPHKSLGLDTPYERYVKLSKSITM
jgi:transposase InsO family protein